MTQRYIHYQTWRSSNQDILFLNPWSFNLSAFTRQTRIRTRTSITWNVWNISEVIERHRTVVHHKVLYISTLRENSGVTCTYSRIGRLDISPIGSSREALEHHKLHTNRSQRLCTSLVTQKLFAETSGLTWVHYRDIEHYIYNMNFLRKNLISHNRHERATKTQNNTWGRYRDLKHHMSRTNPWKGPRT